MGCDRTVHGDVLPDTLIEPAKEPPARAASSACQNSLPEFAASAANKIKIIFHGGVYLGENTALPESVEFFRQRRKNYARVRLQKLFESPERVFGQSQRSRLQGRLFLYASDDAGTCGLRRTKRVELCACRGMREKWPSGRGRIGGIWYEKY